MRMIGNVIRSVRIVDVLDHVRDHAIGTARIGREIVEIGPGPKNGGAEIAVGVGTGAASETGTTVVGPVSARHHCVCEATGEIARPA